MLVNVANVDANIGNTFRFSKNFELSAYGIIWASFNLEHEWLFYQVFSKIKLYVGLNAGADIAATFGKKLNHSIYVEYKCNMINGIKLLDNNMKVKLHNITLGYSYYF